jgi:hypothetical protein
MAGLQMPIFALPSTAATTRPLEGKARKILDACCRIDRIPRIVLFSMAVATEQNAFFEFVLHPHAVSNRVIHLDTDRKILFTDVVKIHRRKVTCIATTTAHTSKKGNRPRLNGTVTEASALIQTFLAVRVTAFVIAVPRFGETKRLGRKYSFATETRNACIRIKFGATNVRTAIIEGRAPQAVAARMHLATLSVDHDARWNRVATLFTWMRLDDPPDGLTPETFDGQATAIGVPPTHDRKTVGKAVSSLRLVR